MRRITNFRERRLTGPRSRAKKRERGESAGSGATIYMESRQWVLYILKWRCTKSLRPSQLASKLLEYIPMERLFQPLLFFLARCSRNELIRQIEFLRAENAIEQVMRNHLGR